MFAAAINWWGELGKAAITFGFVTLLGGAAGVFWASATRRRALDLDAITRFRDAYGAWFATWKGWEDTGPYATEHTEGVRADLMDSARRIEGEFEALLVKIATE